VTGSIVFVIICFSLIYWIFNSYNNKFAELIYSEAAALFDSLQKIKKEILNLPSASFMKNDIDLVNDLNALTEEEYQEMSDLMTYTMKFTLLGEGAYWISICIRITRFIDKCLTAALWIIALLMAYYVLQGATMVQQYLSLGIACLLLSPLYLYHRHNRDLKRLRFLNQQSSTFLTEICKATGHSTATNYHKYE